MDFRSSSDRFLYTNQGIGGNKGRLPSRPFDFPSRMARIKFSSFQFPIPVASDVRLAAKEIPQPPAATVKSGPNNDHPFCIDFVSTGGTWFPLVNPEKRSSGISSGPCGPIFLGE